MAYYFTKHHPPWNHKCIWSYAPWNFMILCCLLLLSYHTSEVFNHTNITLMQYRCVHIHIRYGTCINTTITKIHETIFPKTSQKILWYHFSGGSSTLVTNVSNLFDRKSYWYSFQWIPEKNTYFFCFIDINMNHIAIINSH